MADNTITVIEATTGGTKLGAIDAMQGVTPVKIGKQTVVDQTGTEVPFAKDASVTAVTTSLGTDGATPPTIAGTGVRGWLRAIYERLVAGIGRNWSLSSGSDSVTVTGSVSVAGAVEVMNDAGNPLPVNGTVSVGNFPATQPVSGEVAANITKVNGAAHAAGNPLFADVTDRAGRALGAVSGTVTANQGTAGASPWPVSDGGGSLTIDGTVSVGNFPANQGVNLASGPGTSVATPAIMRRVPNDLCVNATGAAAAAVTLTIPAVAGAFHYIDAIEITLYSTAARTGVAAPVTVTSTNLPGAPTWIFESAGAIGTAVRYALSASCAFKSTTVNTATTVVCPAVTGGFWNVKAIYSAAP